MPISDWDVEFTLITPEGSLFFNDDGQLEGYYVLVKEACDAGANTRATRNPVPQSGGAILHKGFDDGYLAKLSIAYFAGHNDPACGTSAPTLAAMDDLLMRHLRSILNGGGRLLFTPVGEAQRLLDELRVVERAVIAVESGLTGVSFTLASPFPYTLDFAQTLTQLNYSSPSAILLQEGTAPFFPVFKVYGPADDWEIVNVTTGKVIKYDSNLPGAVTIPVAHYLEIDCFKNTAFLDGSGANRMAGIDPTVSDFFTLEVGANEIEILAEGTDPAPDVDILWQNAWW